MMAPVFLDTVGLIAVWDKSDPWHAMASRVYHRLNDERRVLFTSIYVPLECGNAAAKKPYRESVADLFDYLDPDGLVLTASRNQQIRARLAYRERANGAAGLVDQFSFVLMRDSGAVEAFTNDKHFKAAGFVALF